MASTVTAPSREDLEVAGRTNLEVVLASHLVKRDPLVEEVVAKELTKSFLVSLKYLILVLLHLH